MFFYCRFKAPSSREVEQLRSQVAAPPNMLKCVKALPPSRVSKNTRLRGPRKELRFTHNTQGFLTRGPKTLGTEEEQACAPLRPTNKLYLDLALKGSLIYVRTVKTMDPPKLCFPLVAIVILNVIVHELLAVEPTTNDLHAWKSEFLVKLRFRLQPERLAVCLR